VDLSDGGDSLDAPWQPSVLSSLGAAASAARRLRSSFLRRGHRDFCVRHSFF
jgi:hypothetical protein